ncbi:MAG: excinuclease ABC subunit UvrA [Nanoarchaeota archaeon]|nr:excinuclease ABC subunit UvrA [Nanoarchaeota archaeon]MBU4451289.1 excinuclease ABC subunit UvrA [Nanoarchaeota archaeon]MCG2723578.1 excinuclease ABC subunit UvrA [archaeon]
MQDDKIIIRGAREHNLKNIDVAIPRNKLVVITGVSGSGKSTLAFDTLYAEGQRRYVESLSPYARQFLGLMNKPDVDSIDGLSPAISIDQKTTSKNPRSTVGTVTEIYDYLRLLFARIGHPHCPVCGDEIRPQSVDEIVEQIMKMPEGTKVQILSPVIRQRKGEYTTLVKEFLKKGFTKIRVNGVPENSNEEIRLDKQKKHSIEIIVDRLVIGPEIKTRLSDSVETALREAEGLVLIVEGRENPSDFQAISKLKREASTFERKNETLYSQKFACPKDNVSLPEFTPRMFSFNSPFGACPECQGLGVKLEFDVDLIIPDKNITIREGAIKPWSGSFKSFYMQRLEAVAEQYGFRADTPIKDLKKEELNIILYGSGGEKVRTEYLQESGSSWVTNTVFEGVVNNLKRLYSETKSEARKEEIMEYMRENPCMMCRGKRLKKEVLAVTVAEKSIMEITGMPIKNCLEFFDSLSNKLTERERTIAKLILKEINARLEFMMNVGLDYLTLSRASGTLSGGEAQRIRLATQIGSNLVGVMYVLDEPSIGLHQRDNTKLIGTLKRLRDLGNTVIVVEHDEETMIASDHLIDMGPGAGVHGGHVVAEGTPEEIMRNEKSLTGQYLVGKKSIPLPERRRAFSKCLIINGASENNLKNIDVRIPLGVLVCITGVSGSGKSTLITDTLYAALMHRLYGSRETVGRYKSLEGIHNIDKVIAVDQSPIGRTPRSNPATYTKLFGDIRDLFAITPDARQRGYGPGRFSFNVPVGRCSACEGEGVIKIEMHFLADIYMPCEVCKGKRYSSETLEVKYKGKSIADVLDMTVDEAFTFFEAVPNISRKLETLRDVGLGYMKLGQPATTLSGGEAQRIKLTSELSKRGTGRTMYILDEPTTGLHFDDVKKLLSVLNRLAERGNTVVVIEHNLDVIKTADWVIDLGPDGGDAGGRVIAAGTPEEVAGFAQSYTGHFLKKVLNHSPTSLGSKASSDSEMILKATQARESDEEVDELE